MTRDEVRRTIRQFILSNFLPGEEPQTLKDSTLLVSGGVVTSVSMLELVDFMELEFSFTIEPEDIGVGRMDTVDLIVDLVMNKIERAGRPDSRSARPG